MLAHLSINNFAIVKSLQLELTAGMTTITGETGAGKSIAIDALGLCLGDRSEASMVRHGEDKAEVTALFEIDKNIAATRWLEDNQLLDGNECILRRVINKDGRSRAFINGSPVPLSQLRFLAENLINIHGQHAHHQLMKPEYQLSMLDQYAGHSELLNKCSDKYQVWRQADNDLKQLIENKQKNLAEKQLLEYQIKELDELDIQEQEFEQLEEEHKRLTNGGEISHLCQYAIATLYEGEDVNALAILQSVNQSLIALSELDDNLTSLPNLIAEAMIQVEEANNELRHYIDGLDLDPERLMYVEERFSNIMSMARKHTIMPEKLYAHHQELKQKVAELDFSDEKLSELQQSVDNKYQFYLKQAEKLSKSRTRYAKELNKLISQSMHELSMEKAKFQIDFSSQTQSASPIGIDKVEFLVSTNLGQQLQPLGKVASGGELSRISLAIQVITAQKIETPSLIFDEVDVGISGPTAAVIGKLLRQLGLSTQVLCVTHLPQVAACGHQQLFVEKHTTKGQTLTNMKSLNENERINELARLLGGSQITESTLANAKDLLIAA